MKNYCKYCGEKIENNTIHKCSKKSVGFFVTRLTPLLSKLLKMIGVETPENDQVDFYECGKSIIPDSIESDEGERTLKQYDLAVLRSRAKFTKAVGRMQLTNKRLLFRANGFSPAGKITYQQEFAIDKIDGIEIRKDYRFRGLDLLLCICISSIIIMLGTLIGAKLNDDGSVVTGIFTTILAFMTCVPFFAIRKHYFIKQLLSGIGLGISSVNFIIGKANDNAAFSAFVYIIGFIVLLVYIASVFLYCFKPNLRIEIKTSGGTPAMQVRHKYTSLLLWHKMDEYSGFAEVLPNRDADLAIKELGAIINDIKTLGDLSIEKWKVQPKTDTSEE